MKKWLIPILTLVLFIIVIVLNVRFELFDAWAFFGVIFYIAIFFVFVLYIQFDASRRAYKREQENINKKSLNNCWQRVNSLLRAMPNGDSVEWSSGFGRKSELRYFNINGKNKPYRSVLAHSVRNSQLVVVIYDIEEDDIVKYIGNPTPDLISDPFAGFNPSGKSENFGGGFGNNRFDRYGRRIPYDNQSHTPYITPQSNNNGNTIPFEDLGKPTEKDVEKVIGKLGN